MDGHFPSFISEIVLQLLKQLGKNKIGGNHLKIIRNNSFEKLLFLKKIS